jgi:hypothetical protein
MNVSKTVYVFTVLHPADEPMLDLADALQRAFDGDSVGMVTGEETTPVPADEVSQELVKLGNDGTFFDDEDEED